MTIMLVISSKQVFLTPTSENLTESIHLVFSKPCKHTPCF
uniref:Uncharacterized protein n=1 Tax=Rhizophora mucronata TaxID=61149 RepID=A0A2P2PZ69_RHIMU